MKYMLLIATDQASFGKLDPTEQADAMGEYIAFTQSIAASGELVAGDQLQPIDTATTVTVDAGRTLTTDGPFAETKETIGGYYIVDVPDLDRAVELAAMIPAARHGKVEVRPLVVLPPR